MQLGVPIRPVLIDYLFEDSLEGFVRGFRQAICLWVIRRTFLVHHRVMLGQFADDRIQKVTPLVTNELDRAVETTLDVFVKEFRCDCRGILV